MLSAARYGAVPSRSDVDTLIRKSAGGDAE